MNRLWVRLTLAFLLIAWLGIGAVALIVRSSTESSFRQYVRQRDAARFEDDLLLDLQNYYAENGTWTGAESLLPGPKPQGAGGEGGHGAGAGAGGGISGRRGSRVLITDAAGVVQASTDAEALGTLMADDTRQYATALVVDGITVGWLAQETPGTQALGEAEVDFLDEATNRLVVAALGAALLAVVIGVALAWQLTRPLYALTHAAHELASGQLGRQVTVRGTTEIIELAQAFNRMSHDLAEGEVLRRRMAADIAHELRTPVSVLRGHLEAMLDGVFPLDGEHLAVAYDRTIHLARLVDDLRLLTRAEAGHLPLERVSMPAGELAARAAESFSPLALDAGIALEQAIAPNLPPVQIDLDRMQQVLGNLLTNALRHTPQGGTITLRAARHGDRVRFAVCNTGDPLTPDQAAHVFQPFWRAEDSRERDKGGSGLGLAITRQLVALHGGRIWVESDSGQTAFIFELPVQS